MLKKVKKAAAKGTHTFEEVEIDGKKYYMQKKLGSHITFEMDG